MFIMFIALIALCWYIFRNATSSGNGKLLRMESPSGKTYNIYTDALNQPHVLIAGKTGSGKSVVINGMIATALYRHPFDQSGGAQFILIDPKRVELCQYKKMPHTLRYASEPSEMIAALQLAQEITDRRFRKMQSQGKRKYDGGDLYVIIDEFADLMTTQKKVAVPIVQRLAQTGRAARVHLVIATQTPISEVLPTKIKCNFDSRFGLRTRSAQDSRNIIDKKGLETLPEYGMGYYMTPQEEGYHKIPYVKEDELDRLVGWWLEQNRLNGIA